MNTIALEARLVSKRTLTLTGSGDDDWITIEGNGSVMLEVKRDRTADVVAVLTVMSPPCLLWPEREAIG